MQAPQMQWSGSHHGPQSTPNAHAILDEQETKATLRLLEFCRSLIYHEENQTIQHWQNFVNKFYASEGRQKYTLMNPVNKDCKVFELPASSLANYFHTNCQSGVREMKLTLDGALELTAKNPLTLECSKVSMLSDYSSGSKVIMNGALQVTFTGDFRIERMDIATSDFVELIPRPKEDLSTSPTLDGKIDSKKKSNSKRANLGNKAAGHIFPESAVNEYGVPTKVMRVLEISDMRSKMSELIQSTAATKRGGSESSQQDVNVTVKTEASGMATLGSNVAMATSGQHHGPGYDFTAPGDGSHLHAGIMTSPGGVKRRFSSGLATAVSGMMGPASIKSPSVDRSLANMNSEAESVGYSGMGGLVTHIGQVQPPGMHQGNSFVGSPAPMPATPVISSATIPAALGATSAAPVNNGGKIGKRARNSSVTVTSAPNQTGKGATAGGATSNGAGRSRKGTAKKDSASKRKGSIVEDTSTTATTPATVGPGDAAGAGSAPTKNRPSKVVGSPVSIPSPTVVPMMPTASQSGTLGDSNGSSSLEATPSTSADTQGFAGIPSDFYSSLMPSHTTLTPDSNSMSMDSMFHMPPPTFGQGSDVGTGNSMDENDAWSSSLDFMNDSKGLDIGEFIFDGGFDGQDSDGLSGGGSMAPLDSMTIPPSATILTSMGMNSAVV
ncbi:hypothetical protein BGZ70_001901 [Mortierella alpina]|uniref:Uncharacterized protein n=1 Tax=Mortierella alpina TaxID=64518 RepID=A0A9P6LX62_MORAP|nr:hypothetical protein BGZ70_001901 [Mortierella alpina]